MKHILLVDMNAFFIMCESLRHPELLDFPSAVAGDPKNRTGIILTANYPARRYGVKTAMTVNQAKKLCPDIKLVCPDMEFYSKCSHEVFDILHRYTPIVEVSSIDEGYMDITKSTDIFGSPYEMARSVMNSIKDELGLYCSIGISENKFLAKMASEFKKPLGITSLYKKDIEKMLWPLPAERMHGVGKSSLEKLNALGFYTIGDIAKSPLEFMTLKFKKYGNYLYNRANGIDDSCVCQNTHSKDSSIGRSTTLPADICDLNEARKIIALLSDEVGKEAREKKLKGKTLQITIRYNNFITITRQKTIDYTNLSKDITEGAFCLLCENWNPLRPVRLLGISLHNLDNVADQLCFFDTEKKNQSENLDRAIDDIRKRYGDKSLKRGSTL